MNDLVNLITVQILDILSSLMSEGRRQEARSDLVRFITKLFLCEKMETRICKVLPVPPSKQLDRRRWGGRPGVTLGSKSRTECKQEARPSVLTDAQQLVVYR